VVRERGAPRGAAPADPASPADPTTGAATGLGRDLWLDADGVRLHAVERGRGPLVLLLHGFPDFWYGWRRQIPALAAAGFRAVAVDLRGYNLSGRPPRVADYRVSRLAADVRAVVGALGAERAHVVGHDWGGAVAWHVAARHPAVVDRVAVLNAPHPGRFAELLRTPGQALRSWYVGAFQLPLLPELVLGAARRRLLLSALRAMHLRPGALTDADVARYDAAFARPGALRAALAYYRAAARGPAESLGDGRTDPRPTLVLWGQRDPALRPENADGLERWVPDLRVERIADAGHFVQADAPDAVNGALVRFLRAGRPAVRGR
jgi:pimeloyl-ACP methyl ester carboxylesterase